jgi:hypothetical protein
VEEEREAVLSVNPTAPFDWRLFRAFALSSSQRFLYFWSSFS